MAGIKLNADTEYASSVIANGVTVDAAYANGEMVHPAASWHTIFSGSYVSTYNQAGDFAIQPVAQYIFTPNVPTEITGSVKKGKTTTSFTAELTPFMKGVVTFSTPADTRYLWINVSSADSTMLGTVTVTITSIKQYY